MRVTQSQNVPLSCLSRPLADRLAEAAYRDILGLSYARAFSAEWNSADRDTTDTDLVFKITGTARYGSNFKFTSNHKMLLLKSTE